MSHHSPLRRRFAAVATAALLGPALAGCVSTDPGSTASIAVPRDFRERHPIVLANGPRVLDVFAEGRHGASDRERDDLLAFMAEYRRYGTGPITAQVPTTRRGGPVESTLARIRAAAGGRVTVTTYEPADPAMASPIRLSFVRLQARVGTECGLWPQDLGVSDFEYSESNTPYFNHGCATQSNIASQIADPVDLVRGRQPTRPDTGRRMFNIEKLRQGTDPSTTYKTEATSVRQGVSQ